MKSIWSEYKTEKFEPLQGDCSCDVLIVGGGIAGILCAYFLQKAGIDNLLVEGGRICSKITKNTTAKITAQHGIIYSKLIEKFGEIKAKQYLNYNLWAIKKYAVLAREFPCDFEEKPAFTYSLVDRKVIEEEVSAVNRLGFNASFEESIPLPLNIKGAIKFPNQAQFNPVMFIDGLSRKQNIKEHTFVTKIKNNIAYTNNGNIRARKIIIATHFPFINKYGLYFMKLYQSRSYVIALENASDLNGMYVDNEQNGMSFRNYKDLLLIGGGDHKTGKPGGRFEELRNFAKTFYPNANERYSWSNQDCMSLDSIPYIGVYSKLSPDIFVATGFNKWGITSSMIGAKILTDMVLEKKNNNAEIFSPNRSMLSKQLAINITEAIKNLLYPTTKRCSHLGCALKWNEAEHTWECPCHGSRYDSDGRLIDNPATKDIHVKK